MKMVKAILSGPMFQSAEDECYCSTKCQHSINRGMGCFRPQEGGHYNHYSVVTEMAMAHLRRIFPEGEGNDLNFVLFSTSGVHGSYTTIEEAERWLRTPPCELTEDDMADSIITFVIVQPRLCTIHYGNCKPKNLDDIEFLKKLRETSWQAVQTIGTG
jgi:hypothetical protein